jgi:hypothetical protein
MSYGHDDGWDGGTPFRHKDGTPIIDYGTAGTGAAETTTPFSTFGLSVLLILAECVVLQYIVFTDFCKWPSLSEYCTKYWSLYGEALRVAGVEINTNSVIFVVISVVLVAIVYACLCARLKLFNWICCGISVYIIVFVFYPAGGLIEQNLLTFVCIGIGSLMIIIAHRVLNRN